MKAEPLLPEPAAYGRKANSTTMSHDTSRTHNQPRIVRLKPGAVLLVEPDPEEVSRVQLALARAGVRNALHVVGTGEEAIAILSREASSLGQSPTAVPALVLLDLLSPTSAGLEVLRWIRSHPRLDSLPVIVLGGSVDLSTLSKAHELGASTFALKPIDPERLHARLSELRRFRPRRLSMSSAAHPPGAPRSPGGHIGLSHTSGKPAPRACV